MKSLSTIKNKVCDELDEIADNGDWSAGTLEAVDKLTHTLKSIKTIEAMEDKGYSNDSYPKYTERYHDSRYDDRYSRDGMIDRLQRMLNEASTDKDKRAIKECIDKMER